MPRQARNQPREEEREIKVWKKRKIHPNRLN